MTEEQRPSKQADDVDETIPTQSGPQRPPSDPGSDVTIPMPSPGLDQTVPTDFNTDDVNTIGMQPTIPNYQRSDSDTNATIPNQGSQQAGEFADVMRGQVWGDFEIGEKIGQGGMGAVYKGRQISLDRQVAIKVLPTHLSSDPSFRKRFELEAKAVASITSPYIIQVYGAGQHGGHSFFAMEFVQGKDLSERLKDGLRPTPVEAAEFMLQAARGLAAAGEHNLIHRDIKPGNMMVTDKGELKIMDFGLVKLKNEDGSSGHGLTMAGAVMGTVNYFSPEQGRGEECDQTTDIYAIGVVFYQLLTGTLPFTGSDATAVIYQHIHAEPRPLKDIKPDIPDSFQAIVNKCLQKDRRKRYQSAEELVKDLELIIDGAKPQHAPIDDAGTASVVSVADRKGSGVGVIITLLIIAAAAGGGYWWWQQQQEQLQQSGQQHGAQSGSVDPLTKAGELLGVGKLEAADTLITRNLNNDPGNEDWLQLAQRLEQLRADEALTAARQSIKDSDFEMAAVHLDRAVELGADELVIEELRAVIRMHSGLTTTLTVIRSHLSEGLPDKALEELNALDTEVVRSNSKAIKALRDSAIKMKGELETAHNTLAAGDVDTARGLFQASLNAYPNAAARNGLKALAAAGTINRALEENQVALAEEQLRELRVLIPGSPALGAFKDRIEVVTVYMNARQAARRGDLEQAAKLAQQLEKLVPDTVRVKELRAYIKERSILAAFRAALEQKNLKAAQDQMEALKKHAPESESVQLARREYKESQIEEAAAEQARQEREQRISEQANAVKALIQAEQPDFNLIDQRLKELASLSGSDHQALKSVRVLLQDRRAEIAIAAALQEVDDAVMNGQEEVLQKLVASNDYRKVLNGFMNKSQLVFKHRVEAVKRSAQSASVRAVLKNGYVNFPENELRIDYQFKQQDGHWRLQSFKPVQ